MLESTDRQLIGIEVKAAAMVSQDDFRGLKKLQTLTGKRFISGIVLHDGDQALPLARFVGGSIRYAVV